MFVKMFSQMHMKLPAEEMFAGLQGMLVYNSASFLSDNPNDRTLGETLTNAISKVSGMDVSIVTHRSRC